MAKRKRVPGHIVQFHKMMEVFLKKKKVSARNDTEGISYTTPGQEDGLDAS